MAFPSIAIAPRRTISLKNHEDHISGMHLSKKLENALFRYTMHTQIVPVIAFVDDGEEEKKDHYPRTISATSSHESDSVYSESVDLVTPNPTKIRSARYMKAGNQAIYSPLVSCSVHFLLVTLFVALATASCLQSFHDDYFVPLLERARRTDDDLYEEYTYYQRDCNVADIAATVADATSLYVRPDSKNHGVDQMMKYGAALFPNVLSMETVAKLREFIMAKNVIVKGTSAQYVMTNGYQRISYGIEATEHPAVIQALEEIHGNTKLEALLEGLIGVNPALTEITAITAGYGAPDQVWHADVTSDGNAVKFGRTYSHSYSLFIPLQDVTAKMGATDLCAGTHYCGEMTLYKLCQEHKIGMDQISGTGYWPAGSGTLFNQQVWHRGTAHTVRHALDRVVFIVSFLARPNDSRQLSRGTYFHMKWNMWGHTWNDLADTVKYMSWPWNLLTCFHIWRPEAQGWGFDLITSAAMRIANGQSGCQPGDLKTLLDALERMGFPEFLDGTIHFASRDAWRIYIRETIANTWMFLVKVNVVALGVYFGLAMLSMIFPGQWKHSMIRVLWNSVKTVAFTHAIVAVVALAVVVRVRNTPWAKQITSGRALARPFPPVETTWKDDPSVSKGPQTAPFRQDVLLGSRLDSPSIGAYNRWLEFHPGNAEFLENVEYFGGSPFRSYHVGMPSQFVDALVKKSMESITLKGGRFLQQDYRNGDWLEMTEREAYDAVRQALFIGRDGLLFDLKRSLDFLVGETRFGARREQSLSRHLLHFLRSLELRLFHRVVRSEVEERVERKIRTARLLPSKAFLPLPQTLSVSGIHPVPRDWKTRQLPLEFTKSEFKVGQDCIYFKNYAHSAETGLFLVTIVGINEDDRLKVAPYGDDVEELGTVVTVPQFSLAPVRPAKVGSGVFAACFAKDAWMHGRVLSILPDGKASIRFNNGEIGHGIPRNRYYSW